jgi:hypothetical protein
MSLSQSWPTVRDSLVAVVALFSNERRDFPEVLGTGFLVSRFGLVCTCRHVADVLPTLFKPPDYEGLPAGVLLFRQDAKSSQWGFAPAQISSIGYGQVGGDITAYAGPQPPDIAYLQLEVTDTPFLRVGAPVAEGEDIGIGGFPMGTDLLRAPGWLHQITPVVLSGIVSAILPHHLHPTPHGLLVHAQTLGGSSGSPVFRPDGSIVGMVYGGVIQDNGDPTSLALCVSRDIIAGTLRGAEAAAAESSGQRPSLADHIASLTRQARRLGDPVFDLWPPRRAEAD